MAGTAGIDPIASANRLYGPMGQREMGLTPHPAGIPCGKLPVCGAILRAVPAGKRLNEEGNEKRGARVAWHARIAETNKRKPRPHLHNCTKERTHAVTQLLNACTSVLQHKPT